MFSYSGQILPARFAQEFSLYPALNCSFRRLSKKKMTKNKNFKLLNFGMLRSFSPISNSKSVLESSNQMPIRYGPYRMARPILLGIFSIFFFSRIGKKISNFEKYRKRSQMKAHHSLILKLALNSKSGKNFS